jgi:PAS domain S-box-containing protein
VPAPPSGSLDESGPGFQALFEDLPYGAVVSGPDFRLRRVNGVFGRMLGYAPGELVGRTFADLTHPDDLDSSRDLLARLARRELDHFVVEKRYLTRAGGTVHAVTFVRGFTDASGAYAGSTASIVDITERVRAEAALRESEGRYRTLFEGASDAIFLVEGERFADCNARTLEIFGCTRDEILGRHPADFSPPEQRDGAPSLSVAEAHMRAALTGEPRTFEWLHCRRDGTPFDAEVSLARVEWQGRVYLQAIVRDVTERRAAEAARLELERRMLRAQRLESLGVLAGGIAHDFNNLLMAVLGNAELALQELPPDSATRSRLVAIERASRRAAELTRQMLAYSGRGRFLVGRLDLNELVEQSVHLLSGALPETATLDLRLDRSSPVIEGDAGQIQQVVVNLLTNAAEAIGSGPGVITITTGARDCDASYLGRNRVDEVLPPGRYAFLEVSDTGCGMEERTRKLIFEPFFTTKFTGRGLGMAAVLGIVRGHHGAVLLDSAPGQGAVIRVLFAQAATQRPADRGTILVADDDEQVLQRCTAMLESLGFSVLQATDGREAVEHVRRHGAGLRAILLDLIMPHLDGAGALEEILRLQPGARILLSGGCDEAEATRGIPGGRLAGYLRKPIALDELRCTLREILGDPL